MSNIHETDILVLGAGAGGLSAAVTAAVSGFRVIVVEKSSYFGGAMALSGGGIWIPNNLHMEAQDSVENAKLYLRGVLGNQYDDMRVSAFLENGSKMVEFFEANTRAIRFWAADYFTDYEPLVEGASFGRLMSMPQLDASELGDLFDDLRPPLTQLTALKGMQIDAVDLPMLMNRWKSFAAFKHSAKLIIRHGFDLLRSGRGRVMKSGNGVAGRMVKAAKEAGVTLIKNAPARQLIEEDGRIVGAVVQIDGKTTEIRAAKGVVVATGGFAANVEKRQESIPFAEHHRTMFPDSHTGDGIDMATAVGASFGESLPNNGCWSPISSMTKSDGTVVNYPHIFLDRPRPGAIMVNKSGRRFANEATYYVALVNAMQKTGSVPCWMIASKGFIAKYGFGLVRPFDNLEHYKKAGYLVEGRDPVELASKIGVDPEGLVTTFAKVNCDGAEGKDSEFGKGDNIYDQTYGDPKHEPNPTFGPIGQGPYYAIEIFPGDLGTFRGVVTDRNARVLCDGKPISGLYAAGADNQSVMGGQYPGAGSSLGPAMTFGYVAAKHACEAA